MNKAIIYIGGYKSGGHKAEYFSSKINAEFIAFAPDYDLESPDKIQTYIRSEIEKQLNKGKSVEIIGSSTGGLTALLLFEKYKLKMYLINPLLAKEQFFDKSHPVGPTLEPLSKIVKNMNYNSNDIFIYLAEGDELLNPAFTASFAKEKDIRTINFKGDHAGVSSLDMIIDVINSNSEKCTD